MIWSIKRQEEARVDLKKMGGRQKKIRAREGERDIQRERDHYEKLKH